MDEEDVVYIIYNGILLTKKNKILPFATICVDLEIIMLSEMSQRQVLCHHLYAESKK